MTTARERRIAGEGRLLEQLAALNPGLVDYHGALDRDLRRGFRVRLHRVRSLVFSPDSPPSWTDSHMVDLRFPEHFPAVPIEAHLAQPIFHPNVDPANGFVCLWSVHSIGYSCVTALCRLQRLLTFHLFNLSGEHVIQPQAADWLVQAGCARAVPFTPFVLPEVGEVPSGFGPKRRRLEPAGA